MVLVLALSACSVVNQYVPQITNNVTNNSDVIVLNDPFTFTNESDELNESAPVEPVDKGPVLATVTVTEGEIVSLRDLIAEDPDGDDVEYSYEAPFDEFGLWQTNDGDAGKYLSTITASDGVLTASEQVQVIVVPSNKGPVIKCPSTITVVEGETIDLDCTIFDREGDEVSYEVSGYMDSLTKETGYDDAGEYEVIVTADDGNKVTVKTIEVTVRDKNRAPTFTKVDKIFANEGDAVRLNIEAEDPDGDKIEFTYPVLFDENGVWETEKGDAGDYDLDVIMSDGDNEVAIPVEITIEKVNSAPVFVPIDPIVVDEGDTITLNIEVTDADNDDVTLDISGFMNESTYTTSYDDAGEYEITITADDGKNIVEQVVSVTVNDVNRPPVFIVK